MCVESSPYNRGYEPLRSQSFENGSPGDLKEGFYLGRHLSRSHPSVVAGKFNVGPNQYPSTSSALRDPEKFRKVVDEYHEAMTGLARKVLKVLALGLGLEEGWFEEFATGDEPIAVLRLLHYPAQEGVGDAAVEKGEFFRSLGGVGGKFVDDSQER
jgi:isopenicillin N synthase-like dioxygenase